MPPGLGRAREISLSLLGFVEAMRGGEHNQTGRQLRAKQKRQWQGLASSPSVQVAFDR